MGCMNLRFCSHYSLGECLGVFRLDPSNDKTNNFNPENILFIRTMLFYRVRIIIFAFSLLAGPGDGVHRVDQAVGKKHLRAPLERHGVLVHLRHVLGTFVGHMRIVCFQYSLGNMSG